MDWIKVVVKVCWGDFYTSYKLSFIVCESCGRSQWICEWAAVERTFAFLFLKLRWSLTLWRNRWSPWKWRSWRPDSSKHQISTARWTMMAMILVKNKNTIRQHLRLIMRILYFDKNIAFFWPLGWKEDRIGQKLLYTHIHTHTKQLNKTTQEKSVCLCVFVHVRRWMEAEIWTCHQRHRIHKEKTPAGDGRQGGDRTTEQETLGEKS